MASEKIVKNINLLPPELQYGLFKRVLFYQESHSRQFIAYIGSVIAAVAVAISIVQFIAMKNYTKNTETTEKAVYQLQAKYKETSGIMNQISQAKQALVFNAGLLKNRLDFLKAQYKFGHHWALTLKTLKHLVPKGVWLTGGRTEEYYLKIHGAAFDEKQISDFMIALRKSPVFSDVQFNYTQNSQVGNTKVILFEITCNYNVQLTDA